MLLCISAAQAPRARWQLDEKVREWWPFQGQLESGVANKQYSTKPAVRTSGLRMYSDAV